MPETLALVVAIRIAEAIMTKAGLDLVITSGLDGEHRPGSLHYKGLAFDFRSRDLLPEARRQVRDELAAALGRGFDVILEADHFHVEVEAGRVPPLAV